MVRVTLYNLYYEARHIIIYIEHDVDSFICKQIFVCMHLLICC